VDSFTHGLLGFYLFSVGGFPGEYLLPVIVGAVLPDMDILFQRISDRNPRFFIFTHGGFTHSIAGALALAVMLTVITAVLSWAGMSVPTFGPALVAAFLAGSSIHIVLDILAFPGIPILYPFSSTKHTLGIFPGPSLVIFGITILFLILVVTGIQSLMNPLHYLALVIGYIGFRTVMKVAVVISQDGLAIPRMNPFAWYLVHEDNDLVVLESYRIAGGRERLGQFPRHQNITREELLPYLERPEVRRHLYYSYVSVAQRNDDTVRFYDPIRKERFIWYPPEYVCIEVEWKKQESP
jgi:Predicted membrane-bound metal-dependent hydrolases